MNARLRVPAESLEKYKTSSTWKEFGEILSFDNNVHFYPAKYKVSFFIPENGSFSQSAQEGTNLSFNIQPNDGWELHSLTINGSDKTVSVSGDFETGPIYSDIEILAVFQCTSTSIDTTERCSSDIRVAISGHNVNIQGKYNQMELYDISGDCILSGHQDSIAIEQPGLYILQIDGKPYKFIIR